MLTKKEIRYAMIKGWAEKKHPEIKPQHCKPLSGQQLQSYMDNTVRRLKMKPKYQIQYGPIVFTGIYK